jgi:hypothetical protein
MEEEGGDEDGSGDEVWGTWGADVQLDTEFRKNETNEWMVYTVRFENPTPAPSAYRYALPEKNL